MFRCNRDSFIKSQHSTNICIYSAKWYYFLLSYMWFFFSTRKNISTINSRNFKVAFCYLWHVFKTPVQHTQRAFPRKKKKKKTTKNSTKTDVVGESCSTIMWLYCLSSSLFHSFSTFSFFPFLFYKNGWNNSWFLLPYLDFTSTQISPKACKQKSAFEFLMIPPIVSLLLQPVNHCWKVLITPRNPSVTDKSTSHQKNNTNWSWMEGKSH